MNIKNQKGVALVVSLVILIAMTLVGVTSMKGSMNEITMAGNLRETGLTFQAAEAGLRQAESYVSKTISSAEFNGNTPGKLGKDDKDPDYLDASSWSGTETTSLTLAGISTNPQYIIKHLGPWAQNPLAMVNTGGGYAGQLPGRIKENYRITSRGEGQTGKTFRTVQSYYGIEY